MISNEASLFENFEVKEVKTMADVIVHSRIKEVAAIDGRKLEVSADFYTALAKKVENIIKEACQRARANSRNTVMGRDV